MPLLYYLNVTLHVLAAVFWLGGMFFLGTVGAPVLRGVEPAALRQRLFQELGLRFRRVGWGAVTVLVVTGIINLSYKGWLTWDVLGSASYWRTGVGHALAAKLVFVTLMIATSLAHDFVFGPRAGAAQPGSEQALRLRKHAVLLARVNGILGLLIVIAAVRLARG